MAFDVADLIKIDPDTQEASGPLFDSFLADMIPDTVEDPDDELLLEAVAGLALGIANGLKSLFEHIDTLEASLADLNARVTANEDKLITNTADLGPLITDFGSLTGDQTGLEGLLDKMQTDLATLTADLAAAAPAGTQ